MLNSGDLSFDELRRIDRVCDKFEEQLNAGQSPSIETVVEQEGNFAIREFLLAQLISVEIEFLGTGFNHENYSLYSGRFSEYRSAVDSVFRVQELTHLVEDLRKTIISEKPRDPELVLEPGSKFGKYEIINCIDSGTFGVVYHAYDTELERNVALKLSRFADSDSSQVQERFIEEAKSAAQINASGVATIYDLFTDNGRICIVQEFIDGFSLCQLIAYKRLTVERSVLLTIQIAEAIALAHEQGIYHRDLKPGNIIIDRMGKPTLVDFGLAIRANSSSNPVGLFGTPSYMSPEQVRGESNRTDRTTDIWALGVVLYELLTGVRPFSQSDQEKLFEAIQTRQPKSLNAFEPAISKELNRIVFKCIAKRKQDRYRDAKSLVLDLKRYLNHEVCEASNEVVEFVSRGLRSFETEDKPFFHSLLSGPRDHCGVPESISFWTRKIEISDNPDVFSVGLIYGHSGCGKSSLVKAGLLPQLSQQVKPIYVEANRFETELRLFDGLRQSFPGIPENMSLPDTLAAIRDGNHLHDDEKLLVVIDQFEQWLSMHTDSDDSQLGDALRHSDGRSIQVLLLVRENYWSAANRFMQQIEIPVVQNQNCRAVDLFDRTHAKRLLFKFGKAHHRFLGEIPNREQDEFLDRVVSELVVNGKVLAIRLAMFSEAFKYKEWTLKNLGEFGGADGIGVGFLNETFVFHQAPAVYKSHRRAAQECLHKLLPAVGSDLKGHMMSKTDLIKGSREPASFEQLIDILDQDLKLITPIETVRKTKSDTGERERNHEPYFQLTHDYLVPIIRRWIDIEDQRHLQGRVESRLEAVSQAWGEANHSRYLPTLWETVCITLFSRWKRWSELQHRMMWVSYKKHAVTTAIGLCAFLMLSFIGYRHWQVRKINAYVDTIKRSLVSDVESNVDTLVPFAHGLVPRIQQELGRLNSIDPASEEHEQLIGSEYLKLSIALAMLNDSNWGDVAKGLEFVPKDQVQWLAEFLKPKHEQFLREFADELTVGFDSGDRFQFHKSIALANWGEPKYLARFLVNRDIGEARTILKSLGENEFDSSSAFQDVVNELQASVVAEPGEGLTQVISKYKGVINGAAGVALQIPMTELEKVLGRLHAQRYLPTSVRPFYVQDEKFAALAFRRDPDFIHAEFENTIVLEQFETAKLLDSRNNELAQSGWNIVDISYCTDAVDRQEQEFVGLWLYQPGAETRLDPEVEFLEDSIKENTADGFQIERMFSWSVMGAPRYSLIWSKIAGSEMTGAEFLRKATSTYLCDLKSELIGANFADCQILPIDLTQPDAFRMYQERRRYELLSQCSFYHCNGRIARSQARMLTYFAALLERMGQVEDASYYFQKITADNPAWIDKSLENLNFLSRLPDQEGFDAEKQRLMNLELSDGQKYLRLPMAELRLSAKLGDKKKATEQYHKLLEKFDELEIDYEEKQSSLDYILYCRIRTAAIYSLVADNAKEVLQIAAQKFSQLIDPDFRYMILEPDFDLYREIPEYHNFISSKGCGHRVSVASRLDEDVTTSMDFANSIPKLINEVKLTMANGFIPRTVSCQPLHESTQVLGRIISEKLPKDEALLREKRKRLAQAAVLLDLLGQPELKNQIESGEFGAEVQFQLQMLIDQ